MKMRILLYSWNANNEQILADNFIKLGFDVIWFRKGCKHYTRDMELAMEMIQCIHTESIEAVVSFNYFPIISMICNTRQIPYYAWVYDCPHFTLYAKQITLPCNHIGIFDKEMVRQLEGYGVTTVYHAPLSADVGYFGKVIARASRKEREKYQCDISFVGSLYTDEHNYYDMLFPGMDNVSNIDSAWRIGRGDDADNFRCIDRADNIGNASDGDTIDNIIRKQCFSYREDYLRQAVTAGTVDLSTLQLEMERHGLMLGEDYFAKPEDILMAAVLEKKVTVEERRILLTEIARQLAAPGDRADSKLDNDGADNEMDSGADSDRTDSETDNDRADSDRADSKPDSDSRIDNQYDFRFYTGSDTRMLPELDAYNHGAIDYHTQMPLVFAGSKINLNISLRSIHSGIPLRVLDIMACGGFVLTNWQPEIAQHFEEGVELVTFGSLKECLEKARYYLTHEKERQQIAAAGRKKVQEAFSYQKGLERIFS